jgi:hypothetical protein
MSTLIRPPQRVQRRMTGGWRAPLDPQGRPPVYVGRAGKNGQSGKWGNPIRLDDVSAQFPSLDSRQVATLVVRDFATLARQGFLHLPNWRFADGHRGPIDLTYPALDDIRAELAGRDLMCWCPLEDAYGNRHPCHADVLLRLAGGEDRG